MLLKIRTISSIALACLIPICAQAEFVLTNNTSSDAVASLGYACSSSIGNVGVIHSHTEIKLDDYTLLICGTKCSVNIYAGKLCKEPKIGTVLVDNLNKTLQVTRIDLPGYDLVATGNHLVLNEKKAGISQWLKAIL